MVAYSFQRQFADPILIGRKTHTIRAERKRHARPGEQLQLYTGMRTKQCRLIARATCEKVLPITMAFNGEGFPDQVHIDGERRIDLDAFAYTDGFKDWQELRAFWNVKHGARVFFEGVIVYWKDTAPG